MENKKKATIIIDASQYDLFQTCKFRYYVAYILRRGLPPNQKNNSLDMGTVIHEGFGAYYEELKKGTLFNERIDALVMRTRSFAADPKNSNIDLDKVELLIKVMRLNLDIWRWEDEMLEVIAVEQPFAYLLYEDDDIRIILTGKIDLLVNKPAFRNSPEYLNLPYDHKSYSRDSQVLRTSNQFINYAIATSSNYLIVNRVGLQTSKEPSEIHKRIPLSYDPEFLQQWKDNIKNVILEEYAICVANNYWPTDFTSCLKFNRLCEYHEVCDSSGKEAKLFKLTNNYVETEAWDVTKRISNVT
jgi:hypothetical protein